MAAPTLPSSMDRRRRRRLKLFPVVAYTIAALGLAYFLAERPSTTVIFVRHADTDATLSGANDDPPLSARGRARAELLADALEHIDVVAGPNAIYVSDKRRTQETAAPLAERLNIPIEIADPLDTKGFVDQIMSDHSGEIVVVVSHSNTILPLIDEMHGSKNLRPFASDEYNRLYIVTIPRPLGKVKTLEWYYAEPPPTPDASPVVSGVQDGE